MKHTCKRVLAVCGLLLYIDNINAAELYRDYTILHCPSGLNIPVRPHVGAALEKDDTYITADHAYLVEKGVSTLTGNAEIIRNQQQVRADEIKYSEQDDTVDLSDNINYWDETVYLHSDKAHLSLNDGVGDFKNADYILIDSRGHGQAERLVMDVGTRTDMDNLHYTTCDPSDEFWYFTANRMELDHEKNWGTARNFVLRVKDVPIFYSPYISFPLSDARKSGFLAPSYGSTNDYGLQLQTPYYWNIAPNIDATLTPRFFSSSGMMATGEFRFLTKTGYSIINAEYLPSDNQFDDKHRNLLSMDIKQNFKGVDLYIDYTRASDKFYFEDFGNQLSITSTSYLRQHVRASYRAPNWNLLAAIQNYQIASPLISDTAKPYKRLPHIYFNYARPEKNQQFNLGVNSQLAYFYRDNGLATNVNGMRFDIKSYISYPMVNIYSFLKPKLGLRYTQYQLDDNPSFKSSPSRILPYFSLDSGLFFYRDINLFAKGLRQTLEPRIFYLYIPEEDQDNLPVFDTGLYTLSYNTLFLEDRFSSVDRMGDANQITFAVASQLIDKQTGVNYGSFTIGQRFYLRDRKITLPNQVARDGFASSLVANVNIGLIKHTTLDGEFQWNPHIPNGTERATLMASYNPAPGKILNISYRVVRSNEVNTQHELVSSNLGIRATDIEQTDISFSWPLTGGWGIVGRWNYSITENRSLETFGGIEYESCCWGARAVARRFLSSFDGDFETGVFLQLELKGLAGVGKETVNFLKQQIPGYKSDF